MQQSVALMRALRAHESGQCHAALRPFMNEQGTCKGRCTGLTADVRASAAGSKAYTVPYTVTVKGAGPYTSVSPWEWSASVDASGLVLPYTTACCA